MSAPNEEREDVFMEDEIAGAKLARIAAISVVVALVGVGAAYALLRASGGSKPGSPDEAPVAAAAIGMVEQTAIEDQRRGLAVRERDRATLERDGGIDDAIAAVVKMYNDGGAR